MIIKKYLSDTEENAIEYAKKELGPEMIVLTTRRIRPRGISSLLSSEKVEVTVAVDDGTTVEEESKLHQTSVTAATAEEKESWKENLLELKNVVDKASSPLHNEDESVEVQDVVTISAGASQKQKEEGITSQKSSAVKNLEAFRQCSERLVDRFGDNATQPVSASRNSLDHAPLAEEHSPANIGHSSIRDLSKPSLTDGGRDHSTPWHRPITTPGGHADTGVPPLREMIREEVLRAYHSCTSSSADDETNVVAFLTSKGVSRSIAREISTAIAERFRKFPRDSIDNVTRMNALKNELSRYIGVTGPIRLNNKHCTVAVIVGPSGVGKTTTVMKIAAQYSWELKKKVGIFSFTEEQGGPQEKLQAFSKLWEIPVYYGSDSRELHTAVDDSHALDLMLIDTVGRSQYNWNQIQRVRTLLQSVESSQVYLAISASLKDVDILGAIRQFSGFNLEGLVVTKMDETVSLGSLVNICYKTTIPLAYVSAGHRIPDDLALADSEELARAILMKHNRKEYKDLSALAER